MKKIFEEFKKFITKGNVVDLAVGMIIGAAFTAIVNALVNNIFKPLINAIPMEGVEGLITMLVPRDANGIKVAADSALIDLSQSVYIDWGAFIMAIINFFLTAIVLFALVKVINGFREGMGGVKNRAELVASLTDEEKATCKNPIVPKKKELKAIVAAREEKAAAEAEAAELQKNK
jgi:large conductance mechanosensitive channel